MSKNSKNSSHTITNDINSYPTDHLVGKWSILYKIVPILTISYLLQMLPSPITWKTTDFSSVVMSLLRPHSQKKKHQISILLIVFVVKTCRTRFLSFFVPQMYLEICRGLCYHSCILLVHTSVQSYCTYLKILINLSGRKKLGM